MKLKLSNNNIINISFVIIAFLFPLHSFLANWFPPIIILLWIREGNFLNKWKILKKCKIFWLLVAIVFTMLISLLFSSSYTNGLYPQEFHNGFDFIIRRYFLLFILIPIMITNLKKEYIEYILSAFLLAMFISEITSYGIYFHLWDKEGVSASDPTPFLSHSFYTPFLVLTIFILIDRFYKTDKTVLKLSYLLFATTATINLFINGGRSGQFIFIFISFFYFFYKHRNIKTIISTIIIVPILYLIAYKYSPVFKNRSNKTINTFNKIIENKNYYKYSFGQRVAMWKISLDSFKNNPSIKTLLIGVGFGDTKTVYMKTLETDKYPAYGYTKYPTHIHNQFLMFLFNGGSILLLLYLSIFYLLFKTNFYEYNLQAKIFTITLFLLSLTEDPLFRVYGVIFFSLFIGMFFGYKQRIEEENKKVLS